jgi:hypothetical protein
MQHPKTFTEKNLLFITLPAILIATVGLASAALFNNSWLKITIVTVLYLLFILFHAFKNGSFVSLQYRFTHGHYQLWYRHYSKEMQFSQLLLAGGAFSFYLFKFMNESINPEKLHTYGWGGISFSISMLTASILFLLWKQAKENDMGVKRVLKSEPLYETIMLVACATLVVILLTEIYILSKTLFVLIPCIVALVICLTIHNEGILPISKDDVVKLIKETWIIMIFALFSLLYQLTFKPSANYWEVIVFLLILVFYPTTFIFTRVLKRNKKEETEEMEEGIRHIGIR